jgi:glycosyltransferase involved in cell wall biosynthesis
MKFSICIPNYNYGRYIGETIGSALHQGAEVEVLVADNASTDGSATIVEVFDDPRIHLRRNRWNVGFAGNLDRACQGATGDRMVLLSSDDLMGIEALATYGALAEHLGADAERSVFASDQYVIDGESVVMSTAGRDMRHWQDAETDEALSTKLGCRVLRVPARALLRRALTDLRTPFVFASTCYPRALYEQVEGYGGGYLFSPDKHFAWKLLTVAENVFYVEKPLFSYRVHSSNQAAQQRQSGALKHLLDQYRATFDIAPETLAVAELDRKDLAQSFVEHDIALRGLKHIAEGNRKLARRGLDFGRAAYPELVAASPKAWLLRASLALGPLATLIARKAVPVALERYRNDVRPLPKE